MATRRSQRTADDTELEAMRWLQGQLTWEATLADLRGEGPVVPAVAAVSTVAAASTPDDQQSQIAA